MEGLAAARVSSQYTTHLGHPREGEGRSGGMGVRRKMRGGGSPGPRLRHSKHNFLSRQKQNHVCFCTKKC